MKNGPGKFVNGAVFSVVQNFFITQEQINTDAQPKMDTQFLQNKAHYGQTDENGSLSFDLKTMLSLNELITFPQYGFNYEPNKGRNISQRLFRPEGESVFDFAKRVQLFESTYFQIGSTQDSGRTKNYDEHVKFVLHADGSREIKNFVVTPREKMDNFDFFGGNDEAIQKVGNEINEFITDPSNIRYNGGEKTFGIGRTVPYEYIDTDKVPRIANYTQAHYWEDIKQLKNINNYNPNMGKYEKLKAINDLWVGSLAMYKEMYQAGIISFEDEQGRSVYYGTNDSETLDLDLFPVRAFQPLSELMSLTPLLSLPSIPAKNLRDIEEDRLDNIFEKISNQKQITFVAGAGDDVIRGLNLDIGFGSPKNNDRILGGKGNDKIYGRRGNDQLQGDEGDDLLDGGVGNDSLDGGLGLDTYYIEEHDVVKDSDGGGKIIFKGKQSLTEITASRFTRGETDPADTWFSVDANGKRDAELLATRVGDDLKIARGGSDSVLVKSFFTLAQGSATGNMTNALGISLEEEQPKSADGTGLIQQAGHASRYNVFNLGSDSFEITGGAKDDVLLGSGAKASIIRTGAGNDRVFGSFHADVIEGGEGNDILNGSAYVGAGTNRSLEQQALDADTLVGGAGSDLINGMAGDDTIHTGERGEYLAQVESAERGDWANGGLGRDKVYGSRGHDFLLGGEDSDWLYGGAGDDVLVGDGFIRAGSRSHIIYSESSIGGGGYVPAPPSHPLLPPGIGGGYTPPVISYSRIANEYTYRNGKWDIQGVSSFSLTHKETFEWKVDIDRAKGDYSLNAKLKPLNNDHRVAEGGAADYLFGGAGNDLIIGQDGNDYLLGEEGDDILWGDDNRNPDIAGDDFLEGGKGDDQLRGGKGDDMLIAGPGNDHLYGGEGLDAYLFTTADLQNSADANIVEDSDGKGYIEIDGFAIDQLNWEADKTRPNQWHNQQRELTLEQTGSGLIITGKKFAATIKVQDYQKGALGLTLPDASHEPDTDTNPGETPPPPQPDTGGEVQEQGSAIIYGSVYNDTLVGTSADNTLNGLGGDDVIHAGAGNDQVFGEAGNDTLHGDAGDDHLYGGEGDDVLYGWDGADLLNGENGNDQLYGGAGADTLFGWHGDDALHGDAGNDALYGGEGADTLYGWADDDQLFGDAGHDRLFGGAGQDQLHGWTGDDELHGDAGNDHLYGGEGADTLYGWDDDDQLYGDAGNDVLAGGAGNDILAGGQGDDQLFGGVGSDVYVFLNGDGEDLIVEDRSDRTAVDVVQLRGLASTDAYALSSVGDDLHLSYAQQRIVVRDQFAEPGFAIEEFHFSDGVVLSAQALSQRVNLATDAMGFVV